MECGVEEISQSLEPEQYVLLCFAVKVLPGIICGFTLHNMICALILPVITYEVTLLDVMIS